MMLVPDSLIDSITASFAEHSTVDRVAPNTTLSVKFDSTISI